MSTEHDHDNSGDIQVRMTLCGRDLLAGLDFKFGPRNIEEFLDARLRNMKFLLLDEIDHPSEKTASDPVWAIILEARRRELQAEETKRREWEQR